MQLIDRELDRYAEESRQRFDSEIKVLHMWDAESGMIDSWHKYCQKQMRDSFHMLDGVLENRDEGVYAYCSFNDSESGQAAKKLVKHGDVRSLSICAGQLKQAGASVMHGVIYELSLVLAGANPGAFIDSVMAHGETSEDRTIIGYDENIMIYHSAEEDDKSEEKKAEEKSKSKEDKTSEEKPEEVEETIEQVFNTLNEKQKNVVYAMIGQAMGETDKPEDKNDDDSKGGNTEMKHNVFDNDKKNETGGFLTHSAQEDMYQLVFDGRYSKRLSYRKLLRELHRIEFTYSIPMDGNRAEDGVDLRYRFGYENGYSSSMISVYLDNRMCSVLEMMIALAIRCEEHIMDDPDIGNRTGQWFWNMIVNLGLGSMNDSKFDRDYVEDIVQRFLDRKYSRNGDGGLFTVNHSRYDLRSVEIWYQMCWYLDENT